MTAETRFAHLALRESIILAGLEGGEKKGGVFAEEANCCLKAGGPQRARLCKRGVLVESPAARLPLSQAAAAVPRRRTACAPRACVAEARTATANHTFIRCWVEADDNTGLIILR